MRVKKKNNRLPVFIDLFAGCGGISLGLLNAGWQGKFAVEKHVDAFRTFETNLAKRRAGFDWPSWLPQKAMSTATLLSKHRTGLATLSETVDLVTGGPPCQGFSMAGRRIHSDPRNALVREYLAVVEQVKPRAILIENVQGFTMPFVKNGTKATSKPYSTIVAELLDSAGYTAYSELLDLSAYGVPQTRKRFILLAFRRDDTALQKLGNRDPFDVLRERRKDFLECRGLPVNRPVSVSEAIGDLEVSGKELIPNEDYYLKGFKRIAYSPVSGASPFVSLMRKDATGAPTGLRLTRHREGTITQFKAIMATCKRGQTLSDKDRVRLKIKKHALTPLHKDMPSATITTLPDDMIHYSEPRVMTVREHARLQTFPDWFDFTGKYTTGGASRRSDCPRYTQVGNAVPPLFAEAIGELIRHLID